jgi:hypothetical protein
MSVIHPNLRQIFNNSFFVLSFGLFLFSILFLSSFMSGIRLGDLASGRGGYCEDLALVSGPAPILTSATVGIDIALRGRCLL